MRKNQWLRPRRAALLAAFVVHLGLGVILALVHFTRIEERVAPSLIVWSPPSLNEAPLEVPRQSLEWVRQPPTPSPSQLKVVAAARVAAPVLIRKPDLLASDEGVIEGTLGLDDVFGEGGGMMELLPDPRRFKLPSKTGVPRLVKENRCNPQTRRELLLANGGTDESERSVMKALRWLHRSQNDDGSWGQTFHVKMTALALLAYLGHCETHESVEFGEAMIKAVQFLVERGLEGNGQLSSVGLTTNKRLAHAPLEHAIGTYALCEAFVMLKDTDSPFPHMSDLEEAVRQAMSFSQKVCQVTGGRHWYRTGDRDDPIGLYDAEERYPSSMTTLVWMAQALHASRSLGFDNEWKTGLQVAPAWEQMLRRSTWWPNFSAWWPNFSRGFARGVNYHQVNGERDFIVYDNHAYHWTPSQVALYRQVMGIAAGDENIDAVLNRKPILGLELFELHLLQATTPESLPERGKREVWIAGNHDQLFLRIFDRRGVRVVDENQSALSPEALGEIHEEIGRYRSFSKLPLRKYELLLAICRWFKLNSPLNYDVYVNTYACFNRGGERWESWNRRIRDQLVGYQNEDGSWPVEMRQLGPLMHRKGANLSRREDEDSVISWACTNTLSLEVYYRYARQ